MGGAGERGAVGFGARANLSNSWVQRRRRASPAPASGRVQDQPISSSFSLAHPRESFFQDQPAISSAAGPGRFEAGSRPVPGHFKAFSRPVPCRFPAVNAPFMIIFSVLLSFHALGYLPFLFHMRFISCLFSGVYRVRFGFVSGSTWRRPGQDLSTAVWPRSFSTRVARRLLTGRRMGSHHPSPKLRILQRYSLPYLCSGVASSL